MKDVLTDAEEVDDATAELCTIADGLGAPAYFSSVCKVVAVVTPRLVRRGVPVRAREGQRYDYSQELTLCKMLVYAKRTFPFSPTFLFTFVLITHSADDEGIAKRYARIAPQDL